MKKINVLLVNLGIPIRIGHSQLLSNNVQMGRGVRHILHLIHINEKKYNYSCIVIFELRSSKYEGQVGHDLTTSCKNSCSKDVS